MNAGLGVARASRDLYSPPMDSYATPAEGTPTPLAYGAAGCGAASFLMSLLSFCCGICSMCPGSVLAIAGIVMGFVTMSQISKGTAPASSKPFAIAGIVLGVLGFLLMGGAILFAIVIQGASLIPAMMQDGSLNL